MSEVTKFAGFKELDAALGQLSRATERNVIRRVMKSAVEPMRDTAQAMAPIDRGDLRAAIVIGTQGNKEVKRQLRDRRGAVTLLLGISTADPANLKTAALMEFGTVHVRAAPFMSPAFYRHIRDVQQSIARDLGKEVEKAAARAAKKRAR